MFQDEDDNYGDDDEMEAPELNLTSWGVDQFLTKGEEKKKRRHSRASTLNELGGGRPISISQRGTHALNTGGFASCYERPYQSSP